MPKLLCECIIELDRNEKQEFLEKQVRTRVKRGDIK